MTLEGEWVWGVTCRRVDAGRSTSPEVTRRRVDTGRSIIAVLLITGPESIFLNIISYQLHYRICRFKTKEFNKKRGDNEKRSKMAVQKKDNIVDAKNDIF